PRPGLQEQTRCFDHYRKDFPHFTRATAREKPDQIWIALKIALPCLQSFHHRVTDEYGAHARFLVEIGLKRKDAEHQIDRARHSFDASWVPSPNLRADIVNQLLLWRLPSQRAGEPQVESRIIDQHHSVRFALLNFFERSSKLLSEITILREHLPQTEHGCVADPVFELRACDLPHLRAAAPNELQLGLQLTQGTHQCGAVIVGAHFAGDEVNGHGFPSGCSHGPVARRSCPKKGPPTGRWL